MPERRAQAEEARVLGAWHLVAETRISGRQWGARQPRGAPSLRRASRSERDARALSPARSGGPARRSARSVPDPPWRRTRSRRQTRPPASDHPASSVTCVATATVEAAVGLAAGPVWRSPPARPAGVAPLGAAARPPPWTWPAAPSGLDAAWPAADAPPATRPGRAHPPAGGAARARHARPSAWPARAVAGASAARACRLRRRWRLAERLRGWRPSRPARRSAPGAGPRASGTAHGVV